MGGPTWLVAPAIFASTVLPGTGRAGSFAALAPGGIHGDEWHSIVYDARTGDLAVDVPIGKELTSIQIESEAGIFTGTPSPDFRCGGSDCGPNENFVGKFTFPPDPPFASLAIGPIATAGLSEEFLVGDLTVLGSTYRLDDIPGVPLDSDDFDLIYIPVPEPSTVVLLSVGFVLLATRRQHRPAAECRRRGSGIAA